MPYRPRLGCHPPSGIGGSVTLAAWTPVFRRRCRADTCRSPNARTSRCSERRVTASARSLAAFAGSPSTISRELRRNASTRTWRLDYKATIAQWHAEPRARRPKVAKLAESERLRTWVQDRLAGQVKLPDGTTVGPKPKAWNGKNAQSCVRLRDALLQLDDALLQLADPGLELLDELTECAILGLKVDVARYAG
jgi:hypothetical protein